MSDNPLLPPFKGELFHVADRRLARAFEEFWKKEGYQLPAPVPDHGRIDTDKHSIRYGIFVEEDGTPCLDFLAIASPNSYEHVRLRVYGDPEHLYTFRDSLQTVVFTLNTPEDHPAGMDEYNEMIHEIFVQKGFLSADE